MGDQEVQPAEAEGVARHEEGGGEGFQVLLFLPEPLNLLGQQQHEGDLHHLGGADIEGNQGEFQPGPVAGAAAEPQGGPQQQDEAHVKSQHPFPFSGDGLQVQHGEEDIDADAQPQGRGLDNHPLPAHLGGQVAGGAEHQHEAVEGGGAAEAQQHQVGLLDEIHKGCF